MRFVKKISYIIIIILSVTIFSLCLYNKYKFGNAQLEQIVYTLSLAKGTSMDVIWSGVKYCAPIVIVLTIVFGIPLFLKSKKKFFLVFKFRSKKFKIRFFPIAKGLYVFIFFISIILYSCFSLGIFSYIKNQFSYSTLFEDYYVNPNKVKIDFPEKKKNLIYIYLESMESSYINSIISGKDVNLIPNLTEIANKNLNFSNTEEVGGPVYASLTDWTAAGTVAQMGGVPLKTPIDGNRYGLTSSFLPGVTMIGEILDREGYNNYYFIGSNSEFAARDNLFKTHGSYELDDYYWAQDNGLIDEDYYVFWGYEDKKLFEFAKDRLLEISKNDEPFNFTMLTVDTHAIDGYLDESCPATYNYGYGNVISCSDSMISSFIKWLYEQDFYEDTVIILSGDHLTMQVDIEDYLDSSKVRTGYNAFINVDIEAENSKNRIFTTMDMFPTTLAALGVTIEGDRLGLGTNLFSNKKTLAEELGIDNLNAELLKNSKFYNSVLLGGEYYDLIEAKEEMDKNEQ